ncbi:MAG: ABC transporter permease [Treponemataceae bacterium]|nr:MAG: ABC transporter permease [Treponemataceae bacterium]
MSKTDSIGKTDSTVADSIEKFERATAQEKEAFIPQHKSVSYWQDAMRRLKKNYVALVSFGIIIFLIVTAVFGPFFIPFSYDTQTRGSENLPPFSPEHFLGTDTHGRDMLVRMMYGTRISVVIGIAAAVLTLVIGVIYGSIAGYAGGKIDTIMMRIVDIIYSVPDVLVVLLLAVTLKPMLTGYADMHQREFLGHLIIALGPSIIAIFMAFAMLYWTTMARIIRGQVMQLKNQEYVTAAIALGANHARIIGKHLLPNCIGSIVAATCLQIPIAIFLESFLSFLGLGVNAPMTSLGSLASDALSGMYTYPHRLVIPAAVLSLLILSFNLFGDGLRDALDPGMKK